MRIAIASRISFCLTLTCMLSVWQPCALALDPALDESQYGHTAWKIRDGFSKSEINVFAQTPDGYLWLGTYFGLLRFDGVRNIPWQAPAGMSLPDDRIRALLAAHDGTLWIGTVRGLASWNGSKLVTYPRFDGTLINALAEDREGTVWVGARTQSVGLLCARRRALGSRRESPLALETGVSNPVLAARPCLQFECRKRNRFGRDPHCHS